MFLLPYVGMPLENIPFDEIRSSFFKMLVIGVIVFLIVALTEENVKRNNR